MTKFAHKKGNLLVAFFVACRSYVACTVCPTCLVCHESSVEPINDYEPLLLASSNHDCARAPLPYPFCVRVTSPHAMLPLHQRDYQNHSARRFFCHGTDARCYQTPIYITVLNPWPRWYTAAHNAYQRALPPRAHQNLARHLAAS